MAGEDVAVDDRSEAMPPGWEGATEHVDLGGEQLTVRTSQLGAFARAAPVVARDADVSILELRPTDESLEGVFSYLVNR